MSSDDLAPGQGGDLSGNGLRSSPVVPLIIDLWRQRQDLRRAEMRLILQCQAVCRRACGGDKVAGAALWAKAQKGAADLPGLASVLLPYRDAMAPLDMHAHALELQLGREVRKHPLWLGWAKEVRGLGELSLAGLIGEAGRTPGEYRTVAGLWKRMGLAVIDGERQRLKSDAEAALRHGYAPQRRSFAYLIQTSLMRSQKAEDAYRSLYDERKAYELGRGLTAGHAHNRAQRYMVKRLLRDAWAADRRLG